MASFVGEHGEREAMMTDSPNTETPSAVVTGAASGIGRALALALDARGFQVFVADIDTEGLEATAQQCSDSVLIEADVSEPSDMEALADRAGAVDLLCLNAGVVSTFMGSPWEAPPAEWTRVLGVNLCGAVNGLRSFVPRLLQRDRAAHILITASLAGAATWPGGGPYAASKHAVLALAEQAALELADTPIGVTVLCPAMVRTAMSDVGADPAEVAAEALAAVEAHQFAVIPDEWADAVVERARRLVAGTLPDVPVPSGSLEP